MRVLLWTAPGRMEVARAPVPAPGTGEVLVRVRAVGVCGSELDGYLGRNSLRTPPLVMGHEFAGEVVARGPDAAGPQAGAPVTVNPLTHCGRCAYCAGGLENLCPRRELVGAHRPGAFAEYVAVPAACCWPLPDGVDWVRGALAEPVACGVRAVRHAGGGPGRHLLVLGAGPMGLMCVLAARAAGVDDVLVCDLNRRRLEVVRALGADTLDAGSADVVSAARQRWPLGADAAIDCVGATATRRQAIAAVRPGGRAVMLGLHEPETALPVNDLVRAETQVVGTFSYAVADFAQAVGMLERGLVAPDPAVWLQVRSLADGPAVFEHLVGAGTRDAVTKVVLIP